MSSPLRSFRLAARLALALAAMACAASAMADWRETFLDPEDGQLDMSNWLLERKGFLPVPVVITEPAVGNGLGLTALFFRQSMAEAMQQAQETGRFKPPDIYAIGFAGTENGTRGAAVAGLVTFGDEGQWRWRGAIARPQAKLDFYGLGGGSIGDPEKVAYELDGWMSTQRLLYRLGAGDTWLAARWVWLDLEARLRSDSPLLDGITNAQRSSGLGLAIEHDARDNIFTPGRGWLARLDSTFYDPRWGSDKRFETYRANLFAWFPLGDRFVLGTRADARAARGDVPFYQLPFVDLRGVPLTRAQDRNTAVLELEGRWNITPRWAGIAFAGAGRAWGSRDIGFGDADTLASKGLGFRYLLARALGLQAGVDVARGPEETAWYLIVGTAWR